MLNKYIYILLLLGFGYSQFSITSGTGFFLQKGESGYGVWGNFNKPIDCEYCDEIKSISFDYVFPMGVELGFGRINWGGYYEYDQYKIAYYLGAGERNNFSITYALLDVDVVDTFQVIGLRMCDTSGFTLEFSHASYEATEIDYSYGYTYTCYNSWNDYNYGYNGFNCSEYEAWNYYNYYDYDYDYSSYTYTEKESEQFLKIGKFFEFGSYVLGVEYYNTLDNLDDFESGLISLSFGSLFK